MLLLLLLLLLSLLLLLLLLLLLQEEQQLLLLQQLEQQQQLQLSKFLLDKSDLDELSMDISSLSFIEYTVIPIIVEINNKIIRIKIGMKKLFLDTCILYFKILPAAFIGKLVTKSM